MKKRILIVEDNITLSQIVKDWLEREGYAVATAIDEPYARKLLRKESFDLILSDVRLPQGDGISLLEWINKEKMDIPFVIMTEYASVTDAVKAIKMGAGLSCQAGIPRAVGGNGQGTIETRINCSQ